VELQGEDDKLGMFNVVADGRELWDKHKTGEFPDPATIVAGLPPAEAPRS